MNKERMKMTRVLFMLMLVFPFAVSAQKEYDSVVSESRLWTMDMKMRLDPKEYNTNREMEMKLAGDTIINGIHFMRSYYRDWQKGEEKPERWITTNEYVGQDGGQVYIYDDMFKTMKLDMDFSLNVGDKIVVNDEDPNYVFHFVVTAASDTILESSTDRTPRRCLHVQMEQFSDVTDVWIEGIGSLTYAVSGVRQFLATGGADFKLTKCTDGDSILFEGKGFETAIHTVVSSQQSATGTIYDLSGRKIQGAPKKGVYILGGKKKVISGH